MRISKVKLDNYVCFYQTPEFELGPGINFIVGKNNSGKTALIDSLRIMDRRSPHRSEFTIPDRDGNPEQSENVELEFEFEVGTLSSMLRRHGTRFIVAVSQMDGIHYDSFASEILQCLARQTRIRFSINPYQLKLGDDSRVFNVEPVNDERYLEYTQDENNLWPATDSGRLTDPSLRNRTIWQVLLTNFNYHVYRFEAQRPIESHSSTRNELILNFNASNLAQVMDTAKRKQTQRYEQLIYLTKSVFSDVLEIEIDKLPNRDPSVSAEEYLEVYVGYSVPQLERYDLRVPLSACGTGLGQVLAMLYVVVTSDDPRVIIIDEPNSFLHPGAIRRLFQIFQDHDRHQYIVATHSPDAVMSVQNKRILLVEREDMVSTVQGVNVESNADLDKMLNTIGTRRSDIFGMDAVIWVEGKTDVVCFKMIWEHKEDQLPHGTNIVGLANTGDLENKKHANIAVEIYQNLSGGVGLLPSVLGFVFDGDKDGAHGRLEDDYKDLMHYLPRQTYENYFLEFPDILVQILNEHHISRPQDYGRFQVDQWINGNKIKQHYYRDGFQYDELSWVCEIKGAKFIEEMYLDLSGSNYSYRKAKFGPIITKRILADSPNHFQEIVELIKLILKEDKQPETA